MTLVDRIVLGFMWLSWRSARFNWSVVARMVERNDFTPRTRRRLVKLEFKAWRVSCTRAARLDREERRLLK